MATPAVATPAAAPAVAKAPKPKAAAPKKAKPAAGKKGAVKGKKAKKATSKFTIDASQPVADKVLDVAAFEKFLVDHIKVEGKTNNLGKNVTVTREDAKLTVTAANLPFSKRYLKYLTKKFLKKSQLKDYMHVIANSKTSYEIRYYKVAGGEEEAA